MRHPLLAGFVLFLALACQRPHVHDSACEEGLVPAPTPARPTAQATQTPQTAQSNAKPAPSPAPATHAAPAEELTSAQALEAFDRAWQTVHDTHFDPKFNGVDWDALKTELRPKAERAHTRAELRAVIGDMLGRLGQSHFAVIPSDALPDEGGGTHDESGGLGFDVRLRDGHLWLVSLEANGAAAAAGVKPGWSVERIGTFDVAATLARSSGAADELGPRKLAFRLWAAAHGQILGEPGTHAQVALRDGDDHPVELELERRKRDVTAHSVGPTLPTFYLEFKSEVRERGGKRIGWIAFSNWFLPVMKSFDDAVERMRACDGMVIDLRGNTGGAAAMTMGLSGHFFKTPTKLGVMLTRDSTLNILANPRLTNSAGTLVEPFARPLAILVDETTGSASEVFAGGLQSVGRARVFGETSAGAVLPAMTTRLPNGDSLLHAMGDFETATGTRLEGRGVVPDEVVPLTRAVLLAGQDPVLEAALDWIQAQAR